MGMATDENHMVQPYADDDAREPNYCDVHEVEYLKTCPACDEFHEEHMREIAREVAEETNEVLRDIAGTNQAN